jgi:hypothetical protein
VLVPVHLDEDIEAFFESVAVCGKADDGEDDAAGGIVGADAEDFWYEARVDVVAGCGTCVAGQDGEV